MHIVSADDAVARIADGALIACGGFVGAGHPEALTAALERRFLATGAPRDLTLVFSAGQGDRGARGVNHFGNVGMTRRIVGGHWRSAPRLSKLALENEAEGLNLPQGVLTHLYRAIASGLPGVLTKIGLHTFVDPRYNALGGGRVNDVLFPDLPAVNQDNQWVKQVQFEGEEYLFYPSFKVDVALIRGTACDGNGNLSTEEEPFYHEILALAQAARNSGGLVIAQVKRMVERHANLHAVKVPGILIDAVVLCDDPAEQRVHHGMTFGEYYNPIYLAAGNGRQGACTVPETLSEAASVSVIEGQTASAPVSHAAPAQARIEDVPQPLLDARTIVQRRAVLELAKRQPRVVNLGVGMPAAVGALAHESGIKGFTLTVEAGPVGGVPADALSFGASAWPEAVIDQPAQFDFYDGGGIDMAFLGLAELDARGNVNVSMFGRKDEHGDHRAIAGIGGFINISQSAKSLVFMGTLTAGGLAIEVRDGQLHIKQEGRAKKVVQQVAHLSFNGPYVAGLGRDILYITERAVFGMRKGRLTLLEIAPGIDLERDVLAQCDTEIELSDDIKMMDAAIFREGSFKIGP